MEINAEKLAISILNTKEYFVKKCKEQENEIKLLKEKLFYVELEEKITELEDELRTLKSFRK